MSGSTAETGDGEMTLGELLGLVGPGDTTGTETLQRYLYQCKVAVQRWLRTLKYAENSRVLCEFVDDVTTDTGDEVIFAQVKSRDRGSWSVARVLADGGGLDALVRSYNHAKAAGCVDRVTLELLLEGPEGTHQDTRRFFDDPTSATRAMREKLIAQGLATTDVDDFLGRLTITTQYFSRQSIDAVTLKLLMGLVPGHTAALEALYDRLLERAISAHLGAAVSSDPAHPLVFQTAQEADTSDGDGDGQHSLIADHSLARSELLTILPPIPTFADEQRQLLEAANGGALAMTSLEFKMRVAGAGPATVERAKSRRSRATVALEVRSAGITDPDPSVVDLCERVLEHANAVLTDIVATALPDVGRRPADAVYGRLVQQVGQLGALDSEDVLGSDGDLVLGLLCELSDQCRFAWRAT